MTSSRRCAPRRSRRWPRAALARPGPVDGADRQRRAERISGHRLSSHARHPRTAAVRHRSRRHGEADAQSRALRLPDLEVRRCASTREAVRGADIVTTVTADKRNALILTPEMIEPGMHLNAVGGDCPGKTELHADILRTPARASWSSSSRRRASRARSSSWLRRFRSSSSPTCSARQPGRSGDREVTIFDSVGFALNDFSALRYLHRLNQGVAGGQSIDLIPVLDESEGSVRRARFARAAGRGPRRQRPRDLIRVRAASAA